jgi:HSP90 family molecular chaperone
MAASSVAGTTRRWNSTASAASPSDNSNNTNEPPQGEEPPPPQPKLLEFQAETRQLLDIVTNSLYTDRDVFLRELVSNASDSLEKLRHLQQVSSASSTSFGSGSSSAAFGNRRLSPHQSDLGLEIRIDLDEVASTITISDTGIGMDAAELQENLGTIARSGSKAFVQSLGQETDPANAARGIIGKFGVGFYSAFMVGSKVEVRSRSAFAPSPDEDGASEDEAGGGPCVWSSEGTGSYTIAPLDPSIRQDRGTSIVIHLKEECWEYCDEKRVESILKRYSNFVPFPVYVNGTRLNTVQAVWSQDPKTVTDETYADFYRYVANAIDDPLDVYHFRVDAPIDLSAVLFTPSFHSEKYGMGRMDMGVSLYSRKVLIESKSTSILPEWLRFLRGVVDSEDLPLAISREKAQDTALLNKIKRALTRKYVAHLASMAKNDRDKYLDEFYKEYGFFLKEGVCQDFEFQSSLSKLLYFESNKSSELRSLDEYISSMRPEQKDIYYLVAPTRDSALASPYLEAFEKAGVEVILLFTAIDDFVMANLDTYEGRRLVSAEKSDIDLSDLMADDEQDASKTASESKKTLYQSDRELSAAECLEFCNWFRTALGDAKVASCSVTSRLSSSPAIVVDNESGMMRRMMRFVDTASADGGRDAVPLPRQRVEINPKHSVIVGIYDLIKNEPTLARILAEQVYDNCLIAAGLLDDSRSMIPRLNDILLCVINSATQSSAKGEAAAGTAEKPGGTNSTPTTSTETAGASAAGN